MAVTEMWLIRHGESLANVAAAQAEAEASEVVAAPARDADVELSPVGLQQADALGVWFASLSAEELPDAAISSPYLRAEQTLLLALRRAGVDVPTLIDERLRDRELGVLDLLTSHGVDARFPQEAERKAWLGKFYYRPPGGESWADLALRVRSFLSEVDAHDGRLLVTAHDAVIMVFLYVCLGMRERELLDFAQANTVLNASVTRLTRTDTGWTLDVFADTRHLEALGAPVTEHSGDPDVQPS